MKRGSLFLGLILGASLGATAVLIKTKEKTAKVYKASWFVAHTPESPHLIQQAQEFAHRLEERSHGQLHLDLVFPKNSFIKDGNNFRDAIRMIGTNEAQISQISSTHLSLFDPQFQVFDLPFLFKSHEHAAKVFDGEIGDRIRSHFLEASGHVVRSLAFTYSGGYRVFVSNKRLSKASDLVGLRMQFYGPKADPSETLSQNPALTHLYTDLAFEMRPVMTNDHPEYFSQLDFFKNNDIDITEDHLSHFTRVYNKVGILRGKMDYVWETNHSLFLTSIVVNEKFFQSLPKDLQTLLKEEAQRLALLEREASIELDQNARQWLINSGYTVTKPTEKERNALIKESRDVYDKLGPQIGPDLIKSIEDLGASLSSSSLADTH